MKVYKARTAISISVVLRTGRSRNLIFEPLYDGSSQLYVEDRMLQEAIERNRDFGSLFYLLSSDQQDEEEKVEEKVEEAAEEEKPIIKEVPVTCMDDMKNYLVERCGVPSRELRRQSDINKAAKEHNIRFIL